MNQSEKQRESLDVEMRNHGEIFWSSVVHRKELRPKERGLFTRLNYSGLYCSKVFHCRLEHLQLTNSFFPLLTASLRFSTFFLFTWHFF